MLGRKVIPVAWAGFAPALSADSECRFGRPMRQTGRFVRQTYHRVCRIARPMRQTTCLMRQTDRSPARCAGLAARCGRPSASDARFFDSPSRVPSCLHDSPNLPPGVLGHPLDVSNRPLCTSDLPPGVSDCPPDAPNHHPVCQTARLMC